VRILARNLAKEFRLDGRDLKVLHDINLTIEDESFTCLLGPSGSGKSTFLRCVAGLETPTAGTLLVDGDPVTGPGPDRSVVFQDYALFPWYTVIENIQFGLRTRKNKHLRKLDTNKITRSLIEMVRLTGFENAYPHQISGGMRQRVALARALAVQPGALLMDEPFAAVDAITRTGLQRQLAEVWSKTRTTVLFVTHSVEEAVFLADEIHVFSVRPATIHKSVKVDLARPRDPALAGFAALVGQLTQAIDSGNPELSA
jgi:NitT/TauT family transport system ATP-binding protein